MISLNLLSPYEVRSSIATRARQTRLALDLTQKALSERAQVSLGTLKLFERTGQVSLETLVKIAFALRAEEAFTALFPPVMARSIEDIVEKPARQRGRRT